MLLVQATIPGYHREHATMAKSTGKDFAGPAQKYAGQVKIDGGPVPIQQWKKPIDRKDHTPPSNADIDLRGERPSRPSTRKK